MDSWATRQTATASLLSTMMAGKPQSRATKLSIVQHRIPVGRLKVEGGTSLQHVDDRQLVNSRELHRLVPAIGLDSVVGAQSDDHIALPLQPVGQSETGSEVERIKRS